MLPVVAGSDWRPSWTRRGVCSTEQTGPPDRAHDGKNVHLEGLLNEGTAYKDGGVERDQDHQLDVGGGRVEGGLDGTEFGQEFLIRRQIGTMPSQETGHIEPRQACQEKFQYHQEGGQTQLVHGETQADASHGRGPPA